MKKTILLFFLLYATNLLAQVPTISGPNFLCINTTGTAIVEGDITYDSYQWYSKFSYDEEAQFEPIEGATSDTFTYGIDYNEFTIKVVVTLDGETYHSNEIILEAPWMTGILMEVSFDDPNHYTNENGHNICEGYSMRLEILAPWNHAVRWHNDGEEIPGATDSVFFATESGYYGALCANDICPEDFSYSLGASLTVHDCEDMSLPSTPLTQQPKIYPNPTKDYIHFAEFKEFKVLAVSIFDMTGKLVKQHQGTQNLKQVDVKDLPAGNYIIRLQGEGRQFNFKFTKK
jgi:hypothetical protein